LPITAITPDPGVDVLVTADAWGADAEGQAGWLTDRGASAGSPLLLASMTLSTAPASSLERLVSEASFRGRASPATGHHFSNRPMGWNCVRGVRRGND
jgi:hypothetical protein